MMEFFKTPIALVVAPENELPPSQKVWGNGLWIPPDQREALDWLTLLLLLGWETEVADPSRTLFPNPSRYIILAVDPHELGEELVKRLINEVEKQPIVMITRAAANSPFNRITGVRPKSETISGRSIRWLGEGSEKIWKCRNPIESPILTVRDKKSVWVTLDDQPIIVATQKGRGTLVTLGFHASKARDADGSVTALLKHLLIRSQPSPIAWLDLEGSLVLRMDDPGGAQNVHLKSWSYSKLTEADWCILGDKLKEQNARMTLSYIPGWVDDGDASRGFLKIQGKETNRIPGKIYPSPTVIYEDVAGNSPGTIHDYESEFRGIQKLRALGLCEVELHGHTHMTPDTTAWAASKDRYDNLNWYHDFRTESSGDADPLSPGLSVMMEHFGAHPTSLLCPQHVINERVQIEALESGFVFINNNYLALRDGNRWCWCMHVPLVDFDQPAGKSFDTGLPAVANLHDRDIVEKGPEWFAERLRAWKAAGAKRFIDFRELAGIVNSRIQFQQESETLSLQLENNFTPVRPFSVLMRTPKSSGLSRIRLLTGETELSLPVHFLENGIARVIIPCEGVQDQAEPTGRISADPNPVSIADALGNGVTTLSWESENADLVEVHVNAPDGALLSSATPAGSITTGRWIQDGTVFYLQNVTGGRPLLPENTLATVTVRVEQVVETAGNLNRFALYLARRFGCKYLIDLGCNITNPFVDADGEMEIIRVGPERGMNQSGAWIRWDLGSPGRIPLSEKILRESAIVCSGITKELSNPAPLSDNLREWLRYSPFAIASVPEKSTTLKDSNETSLSSFEHQFQSNGLNPSFTGWTSDGPDPARKVAMAIIPNRQWEHAEKASPDFKVVAIMTAYNEEDIVVPSLQCLIDQGIEIYFIDNWSTDKTYELARQFEGRGLIGHERFPEQQTDQYNWGALLTRVEEIALSIPANWFIHHDVDEVRESPWPGVNLKEGIYRVDQQDFNCIDHTVIEFHPVDNDFVPGSNFEKYFRHFEFSKQLGHFLQIKAWKNLGTRVSLAATGGHNAQLDGQRVYPFKFLLKHYPIRSQKHGEQKVFFDRKLRWNAQEKAAGWHSHYDPIQPGHEFVRSPSDLEEFDETSFYKCYVVERLSGLGIYGKQITR